MLAALIAKRVSNADAQAIAFNTTDDGMSLAGMFFAKLETMHTKHMSGAVGKVRLQPPQQCTSIMLS
jgi:hypothetical protein